MQDASLILRAGYAYNTVSNLGVVTPVAAGAAIAMTVNNPNTTGSPVTLALPNAHIPTGTTGPDFSGIPFDGAAIEFTFGAGTLTATTIINTSITFAPVITFSDDNFTSTASTLTPKVLTIPTFQGAAATAGTTLPMVAYVRLPRNFHPYLRVAWTFTPVGGTAPLTANIPTFGIALVARESISYREGAQYPSGVAGTYINTVVDLT